MCRVRVMFINRVKNCHTYNQPFKIATNYNYRSSNTCHLVKLTMGRGLGSSQSAIWSLGYRKPNRYGGPVTRVESEAKFKETSFISPFSLFEILFLTSLSYPFLHSMFFFHFFTLLSLHYFFLSSL